VKPHLFKVENGTEVETTIDDEEGSEEKKRARPNTPVHTSRIGAHS